jgi:hypothetical protein
VAGVLLLCPSSSFSNCSLPFARVFCYNKPVTSFCGGAIMSGSTLLLCYNRALIAAVFFLV